MITLHFGVLSRIRERCTLIYWMELLFVRHKKAVCWFIPNCAP